MFVCPNCDGKIDWRHSLTIKAQSVITCVSCGSGLTPVKSSYSKAAFLTTFILIIFLIWVIATEAILWTMLLLPVLILFISGLFYFMTRFEKIAEPQEKF